MSSEIKSRRLAGRINVLVYTGSGTSANAVHHCIYSLERLLSHKYAVAPIGCTAILDDPWSENCALLVVPGGADVEYCNSLNGDGIKKIRQYVSQGGSYLGLCAGGYFASNRCEFEQGNPPLEVVGDRELALFPGICRGSAFPGFEYNSEAGARATKIKINKNAFPSSEETLPLEFHCYFNGGGVFVDADNGLLGGVQILANYADRTRVDGGKSEAAIVYAKFGYGAAILTGIHPEFSPDLLDQQNIPDVFGKLSRENFQRITFFVACLNKLGLEASFNDQGEPPRTDFYLWSTSPLHDPRPILAKSSRYFHKNMETYISGENDQFLIAPMTENYTKYTAFIVGLRARNAKNSGHANVQLLKLNYTTVHISPKPRTPVARFLDSLHQHIDLIDPTPPEIISLFDHPAFILDLESYRQQQQPSIEGAFGRYLMYNSASRSTNAVLEENPSFLKCLPSGFTFTTTRQHRGKGRGSNVWISPPGSLIFSTVIRHQDSVARIAPAVFIQYLAALAIVKAIRAYEPGYARIPVKIKWPNDIYAPGKFNSSSIFADSDTQTSGEVENVTRFANYVKVGGILVNATYDGADHILVVGVGLNLANENPTVSLDALAAALDPPLPPFKNGKLLASILSSFESLYDWFCGNGWDSKIENEYYENWMHSDQIIALDNEHIARARIKGITSDWGFLLAEELSVRDDSSTGRTIRLQSDSNSFDFFKGLIKRKE